MAEGPSSNPYELPHEGGDDKQESGAASAPSIPTQRATRVRWLIFGLASITSWMLYLHRYSWGVIKKDVKDEFGLTDGQLGWLDSAFSIGYSTCQVPTGLAGDLLGPALVLPLIVLLWSGALAALVLGGGFRSFFALRVAYGVTQAGAYPNLSKVTKSWFPLSVRTSAQGFIASFSGRMGGACAPLLLGTLLMGAAGLPWRTTLLAIAVLGVALAVAYWLFFRNTPAEHPWSNEAEQELIETGDEPVSKSGRASFSRRPAAMLSFGFLLFHIFTSAAADQLYVYWIPYFLEEAKGMTKVEMGIFASLPLFGGAIGGMTGGLLNDLLIRVTGRRRLARGMVGAVGKIVSAALVVLALTFDDGRAVMAVIAAAKFFTDWSQPTVWGTVTDIGGRAAGSVFGVVNTAGSFGGFAINPILGYTKRYFGAAGVMAGWNAVFWIIIVIYFVSGLCWLVIDPTKKVVVEAEEA